MASATPFCFRATQKNLFRRDANSMRDAVSSDLRISEFPEGSMAVRRETSENFLLLLEQILIL